MSDSKIDMLEFVSEPKKFLDSLSSFNQNIEALNELSKALGMSEIRDPKLWNMIEKDEYDRELFGILFEKMLDKSKEYKIRNNEKRSKYMLLQAIILKHYSNLKEGRYSI